MTAWSTGKTNTEAQVSAKDAAQSQPRRCLDLFISPPELANTITQNGPPEDLMRFVRELQTNQKTGCLKIFNDRLLERAIVLFYEGKVVGCSMTRNMEDDTGSLEENTRKAAVNLGESDTRLDFCPVEEGIVLSYASLFLGTAESKPASMPLIEFLARTRESAENRKKTACIIATSHSSGAPQTLMGLVSNGQCIGYFDCSLQKLDRDGQKFFDRVSQFPESAELSVTELPEPKNLAALDLKLIA